MAQFTIRVPDEMHGRIKTAAGEDTRSLNGEIVHLLAYALTHRPQFTVEHRLAAVEELLADPGIIEIRSQLETERRELRKRLEREPDA